MTHTPETPQSRLLFIQQVSAEMQVALQRAIANAPWLPRKIDQSFAIGRISDVVDDLFFDVSENDREAVEQEEKQEKSEHEEIERLFVRRF